MKKNLLNKSIKQKRDIIKEYSSQVNKKNRYISYEDIIANIDREISDIFYKLHYMSQFKQKISFQNKPRGFIALSYGIK